MTELVQTEAALYDLAANRIQGGGEHLLSHPKSGFQGLYTGSIAFNPALHAVSDIDHLAPMGLALGESHVRQVLPSRPLHINVVADFTNRNEHPALTTAKKTLVGDLMYAIDRALPGTTDRLLSYAFSPDMTDDLVHPDIEIIPEDSPEAMQDVIEQLALRGLTLVVSDFERLRFAVNDERSPLVAIKINTLLERVIPSGAGTISLSGGMEVNTNKPKKLQPVNKGLEDHHVEVVRRLEMAGIRVASVIADARLVAKYDVDTADRDIAAAIATE